MPKVVDAEAQRTRVIEGAWSIILDDGFNGATMRQIASRANCTTGLVTHYFKSKEDLLLMMIRHSAKLARERINAALAGRRGLDSVRALLIESTPIAADQAAEWRIWVALWDQALSNDRLRALWTRRSEGWMGLVRGGLLGAIELGEIAADAPIEQITETLAAFHYGLSLSAVLTPQRAGAKQIIHILNQEVSYIAKAFPGSATAGAGRRRAGPAKPKALAPAGRLPQDATQRSPTGGAKAR